MPNTNSVLPCWLGRLTRETLDKVLKDGMKWTEKQGLSWEEDRQVRAGWSTLCWPVRKGF
jgi:hypothetical protein